MDEWVIVICHRVATRITQALWDERTNLEPGHAVVWFDWMQYVTIPLASVSTGDIYEIGPSVKPCMAEEGGRARGTQAGRKTFMYTPC